MPYIIKTNFIDAFEPHRHPRAEVRPHLGKFVRKGTRVGTAVSIKQAVAGALATLRNMPASARISPKPSVTEDEPCCDVCGTVHDAGETHGSVPPEPGTQPIPPGSMRRFHVTPIENVPSIRQNGLKMSSAQGIEGPRAIYSWTKHGDARNYAGQQAAVVEFHHDPKNYEAHPYATTAEVPPENIVAIHEPWHENYRTVKADTTGKMFSRLGKIKGESYEKAHAALVAEGHTHDAPKPPLPPEVEEYDHDPNEAPLYHGSNEHSHAILGNEVYLTPNKTQAGHYARGAHHIESKVEKPTVHRIATSAGKGLKVDGALNKALEDGDDFDDTLSHWADYGRKNDYHYLQFHHPNAGSDQSGNGYHRVVIALQPGDDLGVPNSLYESAMRAKQRRTGDAKWDESEHHRGQPHNAGQFASTGGGGMPDLESGGSGPPKLPPKPEAGPSPHPQSKPQKEMHKIATGSGEVHEKVSQIQKVMKSYSVPKGGFAEKFGQEWISNLSKGVETPAPPPPAKPTAAPTAHHEGNVTQTFNKTNLPPATLNGIPFDHWTPPKTNQLWNALAKKTQIEEPPLPKTKMGQGAGVIVQEPDGRVWIIHPTNAYGGYAATFPKGGVEPGMTTQATALKEAYEESGLQVELTGFAGDIQRSTSQVRYYYAKRVGGTPSDAGWESEAVTLSPVEDLHDHLNIPRDQLMANKFLGASPKPPMNLSDMQKTGGQLGSNPGGKYKAPNGKEYYVKFSKSDSHAKNELLASALYEAAGSPVLKAKPFMNGNKLATGTEWQSVTPINRHDPAQREKAQAHFATHAWLANWDAAGLEYDNQGTDKNGKMTTLDPGGSLLYRAQGGPKGNAFGDEVSEWDSLRDPTNKQAHTLFGSMTPKQLKKSAARIGMVPDSIIRDLTMIHGPGDDKEKMALAKRLIARKFDIVKRAKAIKVPKETSDAAIPKRDTTKLGDPIHINPTAMNMGALLGKTKSKRMRVSVVKGHVAAADAYDAEHQELDSTLRKHVGRGESTHFVVTPPHPRYNQEGYHRQPVTYGSNKYTLHWPTEHGTSPDMPSSLKGYQMKPKITGDSLHHVMLRVSYGAR